MSRISRQVEAYRATTLDLPALAQSLSRVRPNLLPTPYVHLKGTWDEVLSAASLGLLSPTDYAVVLAARDASLSPSLLTPALRPPQHSVFFFLGLFLLLIPLVPFVIALDIVIINALHFTVFEDFIFMFLSLPATYVLEYFFFAKFFPTLHTRPRAPK